MNANKLYVSLIVTLSLALIASLAVGAGSPGAEAPVTNATPLGTAFTYQGRLTDDTGVPIDDTCDFQFTLWDDPDAGSQVGLPVDVGGVVVTKGLFTALLDFGGVFDGTALWLKIAVLCSGDPSYIDLSPRQAVTAAPYALSADKLDGSHAAAFALASHTHSAADITAGTLGTAYYSAYSDLTAEGYLDNNADADLPTRLQADGRYVNEDQANSVTSIMIADGQVADTDLKDGAALAEILDDDGSGSTLDADTVDGYHGGNLARSSYGTLYSGSVSIEIPHWTPFTLHLSSGWPDIGGLAMAQGFENDHYVGITYTKYNGDGTSGYGGAECYEGDTTTILTFGSGSYAYTVRCPGEVADPHNLVLTVSGSVELRWSLIY